MIVKSCGMISANESLLNIVQSNSKDKFTIVDLSFIFNHEALQKQALLKEELPTKKFESRKW